jgi:hypothetical protein
MHIHETSPKEVTLKDVENLFRASLQVEGTNIHQKDALPSFLLSTEYGCKLINPQKTVNEKESPKTVTQS